MNLRRIGSVGLAVSAFLVFVACSGDEGDAGSGELLEPPSSTTSEDGGATTTTDAASPAVDAAPPVTQDAAVDAGQVQTFSGDATYYIANGTGACGQAITNSQLVAALNGSQYSKANCGRCAAVKGPLGTVTVKIMDKCPGCGFGDLDLSQTAFEKIAKLSDGRVKVTWNFVTCP